MKAENKIKSIADQKLHKTSKQGKKRVSILTYIGILFAISVMISMLILYVMSYDYRFEHAATESGQAARNACLMAGIVLKYEDPQLTVMKDEKKREELHALFKSICSFAGLKYLYLYSVDEQEVRHHIIVAAVDQEDDDNVNKTAGFGTTSDTPLHEQEKEALKGNVESGYEVVNNEYGHVCTWYMPVMDQNGNVLALLGADYSMEHVLRQEKKTLKHSTFILMVVFVTAFLLSILMIRAVVLKPLRIISERMMNFVHDRNCNLPSKWMPFEETVENEISDIADSFHTMGTDLNDYLSEIEDLTRKQVANKIQMDVARNIQYGIVLPVYSEENEGIHCEGFMHAAKEVGGDFYDSFFMENGKYCAFIGDVSDKGVSAALFMAMIRTMLRDHLNLGISPAEAINRTNSELYSHNPEGMFVTLFAFVLDVKTGEGVFANAGHNPPLLIGKNEAHYLEMDPGMVTGLLEKIDIKDNTFRLEKGHTILIYTDGITDAVNEAGENFGEERLRELFDHEEDPGNEKGIVERLRKAVNEFSSGCVQFDDMTAFAVSFKG